MSYALSENVDVPTDTLIKKWALKNIDRIVRAYTQKGGWEGWAQVEIATELYRERDMAYGDAKDSLLATTTKVLREVAVYPPTITKKGGISQKRADIVVEFGAPSRREFVIIELKCEGFYNKDAFVQAVKEDVDKVNGDIEHDFKPARVWALGFSTSQEVYNEMLGWRSKADHAILYPAVLGDIRLTPDELKTKPMIVMWAFEKEIMKQ